MTKITIKDIAKRAGVSIATVSHVINKTRYVSPDLVERVEKIIIETGYYTKLTDKSYQLRVGKLSEIAYVFPTMQSTIYVRFNEVLSEIFAKEGYALSAYLTGDDWRREKTILAGLLANKRVAGIVLVPVSENSKRYKSLLHANVPFICLDRTLQADHVNSILSENMEALYRGTTHLIKSGHEQIGLFVDHQELTPLAERLQGYRKALEEFELPYNENLVFQTDDQSIQLEAYFERFQKQEMPTACIAASNHLTLYMLQAIGQAGLDYPKDISVVGFGDDEWCGVINPPLTTLTQNTEEMARIAAETLLHTIKNTTEPKQEGCIRVPVHLTIRKSTRCIERGPMGETAISPSDLILTDDEMEQLRAGGYKVGIAFHYSGTEWTRLHEQAIRETLQKCGIKVVTVTEAHFDPDLQVAQLEGMRMQKLDAIIGMPADEHKTANIYKQLSKETNLVLIGNIPRGFNSKDYSAVVSVNERENGQNAGRILGDYFQGKKCVNIGLITHGAPFFITRQRDYAAEQVLTENYENIRIVAQESFYRIENAYQICKRMITKHPEIEGLYVSWENPALQVIKALKELKRTDIAISTVDLDYGIAQYLASGEMVVGLSAQRPYEQGQAAALAVAQALLGHTEFKYVGVQPTIVLPKNLKKAWTEIMHTAEPTFIKEMKIKR